MGEQAPSRSRPASACSAEPSDVPPEVLDRIARSYVGGDASYAAEEVEAVVPAATHRSSARHEQAEGVDHVDYNEKLSNLLEQNCQMMRRNMTDFFREARASFLKEQRQALEAERRSSSQQSQRQQDESEILKDELAVAQKKLQMTEGTTWKACAQIARLQERLREHLILQGWFLYWRGVIRWHKRKAILMTRAQRWRTQEWHLRRTLRTWRAHAVRKKTKLVDEKVKKAQDDVREQVTRTKDDEAAGLRQQLLETKRALAVEKHAREMLAQDMKRSFMRGVCALNMEAMQVMKRGVPPGGMNPNPTLFHAQENEDSSNNDSEPQPNAIPDSIHSMMAAMQTGGGACAARTPSPTAETVPQPAPMPPRASYKAGTGLAGYAVREKRASPVPGPRTSLPDQMSMYKAAR